MRCWILILVLSAVLRAQGLNGSLTGVITDPAGSAVPGAEVIATNSATGVSTTTRTNESGVFNIPSVMIGPYEVKITAAGFKVFQQTKITVETAQTVRVDAALEIGAGAESVTVTAEAPLLQRETSTVGTQVSEQMVKELPFQLTGAMRNPFAFIRLTPGASGSSNAADGAIIAGGRQYASEVMVDGVPTSYSARQNVAGPTAPAMDTVAEFRVETVIPPAEYGRTSGGVVLMASRSGTNQLHGNVFGLFRNGILDARRFNARQADITRQGEFGGSLGGPIEIPHLYSGKNRSFFFMNYTGFRRLNDVQGQSATVPTAKMREGDFSENTQRIYDPLTADASGQRTQFPNNVIPKNRLSPLALRLQQEFYLPNAAGFANNYTGSNPSIQNEDTGFIKLDHNLRDNHRLSGSYRNRTRDTVTFNSVLAPASEQQLQHVDSHTLNFSDDLILRPDLLQRFQFGFTYFYSGVMQSDDIGVKVPGAFESGFPGVRFGGQGINQLARGTDRLPVFVSYSMQDSVSWTSGKHNLKFGGRADLQRSAQNQFGFREGQYTFSQFATSQPNVANTGHSYASFLLGLVNAGSMDYNIQTEDRTSYFGFYVQDDWKLTRKLTLNLGLRYEVQTPFSEVEGRLSTMDATLPNPGAGGYPGAVIFAGDGPGRRGGDNFMYTYLRGIGPRAGLAWQVLRNTVLRAGYGMFYQPLVQGDIRNSKVGFSANVNLSSQDGGLTPAFHLDRGWPEGTVRAPPFIDPTILNGQNAFMTETRPGGSGRLPRTSQWQIGLQQSVKNVLLEATYVGTAGHGITNNALVNPNQLDPKYLALGSLLTRNVTDPAVVAAGYRPPYSGFTGTLAQALRPFPQYSNITVFDTPTGNSTYHALLLKAEKRFSQGLQFLVSYAFSKQITDVNIDEDTDLAKPQDQYNRRAEKSISNADTPQVLTLSYSYELPFGKGKPFAKHGLAAALVGGWSVAAIQTYSAGDTIRVNSPVSLPLFGGPVRPVRMPGVPIRIGPGVADFQPLNTLSGQQGDVYLNKDAFGTPAPFTMGNLGVFLPDVRTPGSKREDISVVRRIRFGEQRRIELRGDFFNAFNRRNLNAPNTDLTSPNFGRITGQGAARTVQLGARIEW